MRPTFDCPETGRGCHCPSERTRLGFLLRHPAIHSGATWGVGHGTGNGHPLRGGSGRETPDPVHEPSNWSSANRPDDRRGGRTYRTSSASWSPSGIGGRSRISWKRPAISGAARGGLAVTGRMRTTNDSPPVELGLDDPRCADEVRIVVDGPGDPVDVRRLEGGDLAERVIVEL